MPVTLWDGREVEAARSRGGVLALADFSDNLIRGDRDTAHPVVPWPPAAIVQKLYNSRQAYAFAPDALGLLTQTLGYYCDLQSLNSEDAITWSYFGPLTYQPPGSQAAFLNWLLKRVGLPGTNSACETTLWRRVAHPETLVPGGPEVDVTLIGDKAVVLVEAKWNSPIAAGQGVAGNLNQIELRLRFLQEYGPRIFGGGRQFLVLGVYRHLPAAQVVQAPPVLAYWPVTWSHLSEYEGHHKPPEFGPYLAWKARHSDGNAAAL